MSAQIAKTRTLSLSLLSSLALLSTAVACVSAGDDDDADGGVGTGGAVTTGGTGNAGGSANAGGSTNAGGSGNSGGSVGAGGSMNSGGLTNTGGTDAGGSMNAGGSDVGAGGDIGSGGAEIGTGGSATGGIEDYNPDFVEFVGEDCDLPEPSLLSSPDHSLPDPFLMSDGSRMSSLSEWACQRAWLKKNVEAFVHGDKPGTPDSVTGSVSSGSISVAVNHGGSSASFSLSIDMPSGAQTPVPAMFRTDSGGVPTDFLHGEGVAVISVSHSAAESAFNSIYGGSGVADPIKWAWYVSRAIDVLVSERDAGNNDIIDPTALGTTGCSYAGKSAFVVGAYDERIALGIPMESGTGGLGSYRIVGDMDLGPNQGEDPEQVNEACSQGWLTSNVCSGNVDTIPADSHFLVAMYAPRGFTTLQNDRIGHLGPVAQYAATIAGAEVYKALGVESHVGYHGGNGADPHNHCSFYPHQEDMARRAIQGFLTRTIEPNNTMEPQLRNQGNSEVNISVSDYANWDTPSLN